MVLRVSWSVIKNWPTFWSVVIVPRAVFLRLSTMPVGLTFTSFSFRYQQKNKEKDCKGKKDLLQNVWS